MENAESKKSGSNIAANIITWIVPAAAFVAGMLVMGIVPDSFSMISFVFAIGLGLMLTRIIFIIRARRPSSYKTWRLILWFFLLAFFGFVFLFLPKDTHRCSAADAQSKFEAVVSKK